MMPAKFFEMTENLQNELESMTYDGVLNVDKLCFLTKITICAETEEITIEGENKDGVYSSHVSKLDVFVNNAATAQELRNQLIAANNEIARIKHELEQTKYTLMQRPDNSHIVATLQLMGNDLQAQNAVLREQLKDRSLVVSCERGGQSCKE